jgi:GNAT superfamily N-acetyltransferase
VARLEAAGSCALVAEAVGDGVVGMAFARIVTNHRYRPSRTGIIDQVFVRGAHRRQGIGAGLVAELSRFFAAEVVEDISLRYAVGNAEAEAFWRALGFAPRILTAGVSLRVLEVRMECTAPAHKAPRA